MHALPSSPREARSVGSKTYFTGRPCPKGHVCLRYASRANCAECTAIVTRARTARLAAAYAAMREATKADRLNKRRQYERAWHAAHREQMRQRAREHYRANKETYIRRAMEWGKAHPAEQMARVRRRQAAKLLRSPAWADQAAIKEIYRQAVARGPGWQVDHVLPLRGRLVSGLHVAENLQILPARINREKSNHWVFTDDVRAKMLAHD